MTIGEKIARRRTELGLSQMQLAIKTGYKSRSSINKIELGNNDIPRNKLPLFAKALNVDTEFFIDENFDPNKIHPGVPFYVTQDRTLQAILDIYEALTPVQRGQLRAMAEILKSGKWVKKH